MMSVLDAERSGTVLIEPNNSGKARRLLRVGAGRAAVCARRVASNGTQRAAAGLCPVMCRLAVGRAGGAARGAGCASARA